MPKKIVWFWINILFPITHDKKGLVFSQNFPPGWNIEITHGPVTTRTTRTPAFWGYPPSPHDYPYYWPVHTIDQFKSTHPLMVVIICGKYGNNRSRTENVTEWTRFSKSRSNDLEDIGQGQRSSHATHLLMLVIICTKYGKNPSITLDATERTRFSRSRPNDLENIGQGQSLFYATHPLILVMICAKYGKNTSRTVDLFFKVKAEKFQKFAKNSKFQILKKRYMRHTH